MEPPKRRTLELDDDRLRVELPRPFLLIQLQGGVLLGLFYNDIQYFFIEYIYIYICL